MPINKDLTKKLLAKELELLVKDASTSFNKAGFFQKSDDEALR